MTELQRAIYPVKVAWLRARLAKSGYRIVADVALKRRRAYMRDYMRKQRSGALSSGKGSDG